VKQGSEIARRGAEGAEKNFEIRISKFGFSELCVSVVNTSSQETQNNQILDDFAFTKVFRGGEIRRSDPTH